MSGSAQLVAVLRGAGGPRVLGRDEAIVHADDLGLTRGDGCFDATLVVAADGSGPRQVLHLDRHLARLDRSAAGLGIDNPPATEWAALVQEALAHPLAPPEESMLKLVLTRGREERPDGVFAYLTVTPLPEATIAARTGGIHVATMTRGMPSDAFADAPWILGGIKTIAYAVNMAVNREAARRGATDALFTSTDGYVLEGPTSALIIRTGDRLTTTPTGATGVLASITVETLFEAAAADGFEVTHRLMRPDEVHAADGAWFVSSVRGIAPIRLLDGQELAFDAETTARLARLAGFPAA